MSLLLFSPPPSVKHAFLLATLILLSVLYPLIGGRVVFDALLVVVLVSGIFEVVQSRFVFRVVMLLVVVAIVTRAIGYLASRETFAAVSDGAVIVIWLITAGAVLKDVLSNEPVTWDKICGAICVYLLIGLAWGQLYSLVARSDPRAFRGDGHAASARDETAISSPKRPGAARWAAEPSNLRRFDGLNYFSFVTLTTLGYGDIVPLSSLARTLAWLEALTGQIYLTVLVARMVGLHIAHTQSKRPD